MFLYARRTHKSVYGIKRQILVTWMTDIEFVRLCSSQSERDFDCDCRLYRARFRCSLTAFCCVFSFNIALRVMPGIEESVERQ